jgi:hypothetical protein
MKMLARVLHEGDIYRLTVGPLGGMRATDKTRQMTVKLSKTEARWIDTTIAAIAAYGVPVGPGVDALEEFFEEVAGCVLDRGGARWQALFLSASPADWAAAIAEDYRENL